MSDYHNAEAVKVLAGVHAAGNRREMLDVIDRALAARDQRIASLEGALRKVSDEGCWGGPCKDIARAALSAPASTATAARADLIDAITGHLRPL